MNVSDIHQIMDDLAFPFPTKKVQLVETHISWVILTDEYVYKIKKPVTFDFLDYSTKDKRKHFCEEELRLNRRLVENIYLDVMPILKLADKFTMKSSGGKIVDYYLLMKRMDNSRQMDLLLEQGKVTPGQVLSLADILAQFHLRADVIEEGEDWEVLFEEFKDVDTVRDFASCHFGHDRASFIERSIDIAYRVLYQLRHRITERNDRGYVIDGHGDLHCRNVILEDPPKVFDCIDFNDDFRKLDMLSEIAFLCMDMERFGALHLADIFSKRYFTLVECLQNEQDALLFLYYKMYRANVLFKVNILRAMMSSKNDATLSKETKIAETYLKLYIHYCKQLDNISEVPTSQQYKPKEST